MATAASVSAIALAAAIVVAVNGGHPRLSTAASGHGQRSPATTRPANHPTKSAGGGGYRPRYVTVPQTAKQSELASALASAESPEEIAAGEALQVPSGRYSTAYPAVPAADTTDELSYARAWVSELLDRDYRSQSRAKLLAWAVAGQAANTLPGVPGSVEDKALYASLAVPDLGGVGGASPVPSATAWSEKAARGVLQRATAVEVSVDPQWTSLVSGGFVPKDPLLAFLDVSGTLTTTGAQVAASAKGGRARTNGTARVAHDTTSVRFKLILTVGSALHHPGYGAVSVENWTVG